MRLYPRADQTTIDDPEWGHFDAGPDGAFDLPEELAEQLRRFHVNKQPLWETDIERQNRLAAEELERRRDPMTLLAAVEQLVAAAATVQPEPSPTPAKRARKAASPAAE